MLRLKELRKAKGITQQELADYLNITQATLSGWETEKFEIDYSNLLRCAEFFEVSIDYILGRDIDNTQISTAKQRTKELLENNSSIKIKEIENRINTNFATLRTWCQGYGDYFDNKLDVIADLFDVTVDYLLGRSELVRVHQLSDDEKNVIISYRAHPEMHEAVHRILGIEEAVPSFRLVAYGGDNVDNDAPTEPRIT